jgi:hypothetical protein
MVCVDYRVRRADREAFLCSMAAVSAERLRDGAYAWGITEDATEPEHLVEWFFVESWAEHLRQHRRVSKADADLQEAALRFHVGSAPPQVRHYLGLKSP